MDDDAELTVLGKNVVQGSQRIDGPVGKIANTGKETRQYFYNEFSRPFSSYQTWKNGNLVTRCQASRESYRICQ